MVEKSKLGQFKEKYAVLEKKYDLPKYEELNENFHIDKAADTETDIPIIEIRKYVADKMAGYLRFAETLLNPSNAPMFIFSIVKTLTPEDKKNLTEIYKVLAKNEFNLIKTDIYFSEEKEAKFIIESYKIWKEIKKDILGILQSVEDKWDNKLETNNRKYFG
jgi:hypothetical protein